jgi:iron-sulfur cluster repair protein YtfE (RIC family)
MPAPRKKITYIHNEKPNESKTTTTTYFKTVEEFNQTMQKRKENLYPHLEIEEFNQTMQKRKENLYPHLEIEIVDVEDIEVDLYEHAYREDSRYNYN